MRAARCSFESADHCRRKASTCLGYSDHSRLLGIIGGEARQLKRGLEVLVRRWIVVIDHMRTLVIQELVEIRTAREWRRPEANTIMRPRLHIRLRANGLQSRDRPLGLLPLLHLMLRLQCR